MCAFVTVIENLSSAAFGHRSRGTTSLTTERTENTLTGGARPCGAAAMGGAPLAAHPQPCPCAGSPVPDCRRYPWHPPAPRCPGGRRLIYSMESFGSGGDAAACTLLSPGSSRCAEALTAKRLRRLRCGPALQLGEDAWHMYMPGHFWNSIQELQVSIESLDGSRLLTCSLRPRPPREPSVAPKPIFPIRRAPTLLACVLDHNPISYCSTMTNECEGTLLQVTVLQHIPSAGRSLAPCGQR